MLDDMLECFALGAGFGLGLAFGIGVAYGISGIAISVFLGL